MKLNRIKRLCKKRCRAYIYEWEDGRQMLSDGSGFWPVDTQLRLNESVLRTLFEVTGKAWKENWDVQHIMFEDDDRKIDKLDELLQEVWAADDEIQVTPVDGLAEYNGTLLKCFRADDGLSIYVDYESLKSMNDDAQFYMLRRFDDGPRVLAVYDSLLMCGLLGVMPSEHAKKVNAHMQNIVNGKFD